MFQIEIITHSFTNFNYSTDYNLHRSDVTSYTVTKPEPKHCSIPYTPQLGQSELFHTDGEFPYGRFAHFKETDRVERGSQLEGNWLYQYIHRLMHKANDKCETIILK